MKNEQTHLPCPHSGCGSTDAFSWNSEKSVGKCFSCGVGYPIKGGQYFEWAQDKYPLPSLDNGPARVAEVSYRGVSADTFARYGVVTKVNSGNVVVEQRYKYPSGNEKVRREPKSFSCVGNVSTELFGSDKFPRGCSKKITITEGELDACSAYQMLNKNSGRFLNPVVSLPSATPSNEFWTNVQAYFSGFDEIILSVDTDGAGNAVADRICSIFPSKTKRVDHGLFKDANDFLKAGKQEEYVSLWFNASTYTPENIYNTEADFLKLWEESEQLDYVPTGIQELDDKLLGIIPGHLYMFKARTGIGKSEFMRYLEWNFFQKGIRFGACHLEETRLRTLLGLVGYQLGRNVTRKDLVQGQGLEAEVLASMKSISEKDLYYQYSLRDNESTESFCELIRLLSIGYGCRYVIVEPIQDILTNVSSDSREQALGNLGVALSKLAADLNIGILSIAHTNDDNEIKYCRYLGQRASVVVNLDRDKSAEDALTRNTTNLLIEKNRPTSLEGPAGSMLFDLSSFTMSPTNQGLLT